MATRCGKVGRQQEAMRDSKMTRVGLAIKVGEVARAGKVK